MLLIWIVCGVALVTPLKINSDLSTLSDGTEPTVNVTGITNALLISVPVLAPDTVTLPVYTPGVNPAGEALIVTFEGVTFELMAADNQPEPVLVETLVDNASAPLVAVTKRVWTGGGLPFVSTFHVTGIVDIVNNPPVLTFSVTFTVALSVVVPGAVTVTVPE